MSLSDFFFDRVTDEIRQQMDGVLALVQRLSRERLSADAAACVAGVSEAAASVNRLLADSVTLRSAATEGLALSPAPQRLHDVMDEVQARWQQRMAGGVTLLVAYDGDPEAMGVVDAERLGRIFDGFIAQALGGARNGAVEATLRTTDRGETLHLEGRIRGPGDVAGDGTPDILEIETRYGLETAIGIALAYRILGALGGDLRIERNRGAGETVVFELVVPRATPQAEAEPAETAAGARAAHILIVDDNATNRMVAETLCEMFDCTSESVTDGVEAVEAARTGQFDLILMDIKMPRMDGVAASRAIRALPGRVGAVPIIALTANADPEDAAGYIAAGMNGVVEKPMKPETLLRALQEALSGGAAAAA
ncbi:MAG: hybrid sensor histidine kinase/response regulator [Phenylobacterium sp.]|uniref:hybrid sensor histidine kinase/response regulator n=1 Tax=Phenylobacterium sp. TaxID=1871053 RepID=UPI00391BB5DF